MPIISFFNQRNIDGVILDVDTLLTIIPMPDVLLVIKGDSEEIINRYVRRGGFHVGKIRKKINYSDELKDDFISGDIALQKIVSFAKKRGVKILSIDNNLTLQDYEVCIKKLNIE